jgi:hypothetical protein
MRYEITLFTPVEKTAEEIYKEYKTNNIASAYYELIASNLLQVLPDSTLKVVWTGQQDAYIKGSLFYLHPYESIGASTEEQLIDTSILVTNLYTQEYFYIDFQDGAIHTMDFVQNDKCIAIFVPQHKHVYKYMGLEINKYKYSHKFHPLGFFPTQPNFYISLRDVIQSIRDSNKLIPKMFFSGNFYNEIKLFNERKQTYERNRAVVEVLGSKYPEWIDIVDKNSDNAVNNSEDYLKKVANYSLPLAVPGHPWSHREQEFWTVGIPTISNTYTCPVMESLVPNVHYVDAGTTGKDVRDRELDPEYASDLIVKKFKEVHKNTQYLRYVSTNIMKRYDNFQSPQKTVQRLMEYIRYMYPSF